MLEYKEKRLNWPQAQAGSASSLCLALNAQQCRTCVQCSPLMFSNLFFFDCQQRSVKDTLVLWLVTVLLSHFVYLQTLEPQIPASNRLSWSGSQVNHRSDSLAYALHLVTVSCLRIRPHMPADQQAGRAHQHRHSMLSVHAIHYNSTTIFEESLCLSCFAFSCSRHPSLVAEHFIFFDKAFYVWISRIRRNLAGRLWATLSHLFFIRGNRMQASWRNLLLLRFSFCSEPVQIQKEHTDKPRPCSISSYEVPCQQIHSLAAPVPLHIFGVWHFSQEMLDQDW